MSDDDWDPFKNLFDRQESLGEFLYTDGESEESLPMEVNSDKKLLVADTEEEELSFYKEDHRDKKKYWYYEKDPGKELDAISANLEGKDGSGSETDNLRETYDWEGEQQIKTEFKERLHSDHDITGRPIPAEFEKENSDQAPAGSH